MSYLFAKLQGVVSDIEDELVARNEKIEDLEDKIEKLEREISDLKDEAKGLATDLAKAEVRS